MSVLSKKDIEEIVDLTPLQEGLLFHYLKGDTLNHQNFEQICLFMEGRLDVQLFNDAWNLIVANNEMLRTVFRWKKLSKPVQITLRKHELICNYTDLSQFSKQERESKFQEVKLRDKSQLFDLEYVPFRISIVRFSETEFVQVISNHSIIYDGWSNGILLKEFFKTYLSLLKMIQPRLSTKPKFKDFVTLVRAESSKNESAFWSTYFDNRAEKSDLLIRSNNLRELVSSANHGVDLTASLVGKVNTFCIHHRITKATLFYAIWGIVLLKISDSKDITFGTTVSGRTAKIKGIEEMVGLLINTLPLRVKNHQQSIASLLREISEHLLERAEFELTHLQKIKQYGSFPNQENIFDSIVLMENYPLDKKIFSEDPLCRLTSFSFDQTNNFDLAISILNFENGISVYFGYNQAKYAEQTVVELAGYFVKILEDVIDGPEKLIRELELVTETQRKEVVFDLNTTKAPYSSDIFIQDLFANQVKLNPNKIALIYQDQHVSYGALDALSDRIANRLHSFHGSSNILIPVVMDRSVEMIAALLGILKAGYAYVPFEPTLPKARIVKLARSLSVTSIVTDASNLDLTTKISEDVTSVKEIFCITATNAKPDKTVEQPIVERINAWDVESNEKCNIPRRENSEIAYIIYTSGSTGLPKGVVVQHKPVINILEWINKTFAVGVGDKLLFVTSLGFDLSVYDVFGTLGAGATIRIASNSEIGNPKALLGVIAREKITIWDSAPAAFQQIVQVGTILNESMDGIMLRMALMSGDWIGLQLPGLAKKLFKDINVVSLGGATEAVIWSNYFLFDRVEKNWTSIPYGRPIQNAHYYILDGDFNVLPKGVIGELFIGGECLAVGYVNEVELTNAKFINSPFVEGEKMYRTGDLARWFDDGNIELIGRKDHQVKIRGFRIELGEIESRLIQYPAIKSQTVLLYKTNVGENSIAAFFEGTAVVDVNELRSHLLEELPEYMVPSQLVQIDKIPITTNGKVDRSALLKYVDEFKQSGGIHKPDTDILIGLAELWAEVINYDIDKIYQDTNFFEIGGHSLSATILQAKIEKKFDIQIQLRQIFNNPSLSAMGSILLNAEGKVLAITPQSKRERYPITSGQKRLFAWQWINRNSTNYNIVGSIKIKGYFDFDKLRNVVQRIVTAHDILRTNFVYAGTELMQVVRETIELPIERFQLQPGQSITDFSSYIKPFDLSVAPLFRLTYLEETEREISYLLLDMHHSIGDGLTIQKFMEDLSKGLSEKVIERAALQYTDYAVWTHEEVYKERMAAQEKYWLKVFEKEITRLSLPLDFKRTEIQNLEGDFITFSIEYTSMLQLQKIARETDATLFVVMLACVDVLLAKICNQKDIIVGIPVANRPHADLIGVMGLFVNTIVTRNEVDDEITLMDFIKKVRNHSIRDFENQEYPFEYLVEHVTTQRDVQYNPLFDVALEFDNLNLPLIQLPEASVEVMDNVLKRTHFDLVFTISPQTHSIDFKIAYATKLFKRETIQWMQQSLLMVIDSLIEKPERLIGEVDIFQSNKSDKVETIQFNF